MLEQNVISIVGAVIHRQTLSSPLSDWTRLLDYANEYSPPAVAACLAGPIEPAFDCPFTDTQPRRQRRMGQILKVAADDQFLFLRRQIGDRQQQLVANFSIFQVRRRNFLRHQPFREVGGDVGIGHGDRHRPAGLHPPVRPEQVPGDRPQPVLQICRRHVFGPVSALEPELLHQVVGQVRVARIRTTKKRYREGGRHQTCVKGGLIRNPQ